MVSDMPQLVVSRNKDFDVRYALLSFSFAQDFCESKRQGNKADRTLIGYWAGLL